MSGAGPGTWLDEVVDRTTEQAAVRVAQKVGHALIDVGDHSPLIGYPDPLLGHIHQLLEPLLALLESLGSLFQSGLPPLEGRGMTQRGAHQTAQEAQCLGVAVGECVRLPGNHLQQSVDPLLVPQRQYHERLDPELPVGLVGHPGVGEGIVAPLKLSGSSGDPREAGAQLQAGGIDADVNQRHDILALNRFDDGPGGPG